jgi:hypothetical protein
MHGRAILILPKDRPGSRAGRLGLILAGVVG